LRPTNSSTLATLYRLAIEMCQRPQGRHADVEQVEGVREVDTEDVSPSHLVRRS
jgi:hypothetical protein